jgi:prefoldin beta subunit
VLLKQDKPEAVMNVDKRLEYIEAEMFVNPGSTRPPQLTVRCRKRVEAQIKGLGEKQESKKMEIIKLQNDLQAAAQAAQAEE